MITEFIINCPETSAQLNNILELKADNPTISLQRLLDYLEAINGGQRSAYITSYVGMGQSSCTITFTGQPTATQTIRIANSTYTAVASGATALQFNIGGSTAITATNLYNALLANPNFTSIFSATLVTTGNPVITVTALEPGQLGVTIFETLSNVTATLFTIVSNGTSGTMALGLGSNSSANYLRLVLNTNDNLQTMLDAVNTQPDAPTSSLTRIINVLGTLLGSRSGLLSTFRGSTVATATFTFAGQPTAAQAVNINSVAYTAVASGAVAPQFNIGATALETAQNFVDVINTYQTATRIYGVMTASLSGNVVTLTAILPGETANQYIITESLSNVTFTPFSGGSAGTEVDLNFGYPLS